MNILIQDIPHYQQRYPTTGDWQTTVQDSINISVSSLSDSRYEKLVAVHELIEALLCMHDGVTAKEVDDFDIAHLELDEPGDHVDSPYRTQHARASTIEKQLASWMDVDWAKYEKELSSLYD